VPICHRENEHIPWLGREIRALDRGDGSNFVADVRALGVCGGIVRRQGVGDHSGVMRAYSPHG